MRILVLQNTSEGSERAAAIAHMLAKRLGDAVQLLSPAEAVRGDARGTNPAGTVSEEGRGLPRAVPMSVDLRAAAQVLEESADGTRSNEPVRVVVVPVSAADSAIGHDPAAEEVALHAPAPTLVLRDLAPVAEWLEGRRPLRVLVAHDLSRTADEALMLLKQFAGVEPCEIVVAHMHHPIESDAAGGMDVDTGTEVQRIVERNLLERVQRALGDTPAEVRVCPTVLRHDFAVPQLAREGSFDLVVAGTHQRHGLDRLAHPGSLSRNLVRAGGTNALLVPRPRAGAAGTREGISRVLVATDLSPSSNGAVSHGYSLLPRGGSLRLLHVVHPRALPHGEFDQGISRRASQGAHMELLQECQAKLRALAADESDAPGVATEVEIVEHAQPAVAIAEAAERFGADVVCMASHQPDSVFGRLFKSQIQAVMAKTNRALLIVHPSVP